MFRRRPRRRIIVSTLADVDVDAVVRELADGIDGLYVLSTEPRRFLWRQRVEVNVDGPDEAVRSFNRRLDHWARDNSPVIPSQGP